MRRRQRTRRLGKHAKKGPPSHTQHDSTAASSHIQPLPRLDPIAARQAARKLLLRTAREITFVNAALCTRLVVASDGLHVKLDTRHRDTGEEITVDLRWELPPLLLSREQALDWIYACVREAWVHELNEALFVSGVRRRDLHDGQGKTILPPDNEVTVFKMQLAAFLMGRQSLLISDPKAAEHPTEEPRTVHQESKRL
jgi:hypothetical protein